MLPEVMAHYGYGSWDVMAGWLIHLSEYNNPMRDYHLQTTLQW